MAQASPVPEKSLGLPPEPAPPPPPPPRWKVLANELKSQVRTYLSGTIRSVRIRFIRTEEFKEVLRSMGSSDAQTRNMARLFLLSLIGILAVLGFSYWRHLGHTSSAVKELTQAEIAARHLSEFMERRAEEAKRKQVIIPIGEFVVELKKNPDERFMRGVMGMAEIQIVIEVDSKKTAEFIKNHIPHVRNQLTNTLVALDREDVNTLEGKKKLKKNMMEALNLWLPHGRVENVFFSRLIVM